MTVFSPFLSNLFRGKLDFCHLYFLIILARNRKRWWKLSGVRKKSRQGYKREYSINLLRKSLEIHRYTRHAYTSTPPRALQPLAFTADLASEKHLYSSPWCSSGASHALWTQFLHPEAALTSRSKLFSIHHPSTWQQHNRHKEIRAKLNPLSAEKARMHKGLGNPHCSGKQLQEEGL